MAFILRNLMLAIVATTLVVGCGLGRPREPSKEERFERFIYALDFPKEEVVTKEARTAKAIVLWEEAKGRGGFVEIHRLRVSEKSFTKVFYANLNMLKKKEDGYIEIWQISSTEYDGDTNDKIRSSADRYLILCSQRMVISTPILFFEQPKAEGTPKRIFTHPIVSSGANVEKNEVFKVMCEREPAKAGVSPANPND